jgi:hypothetical protein
MVPNSFVWQGIIFYNLPSPLPRGKRHHGQVCSSICSRVEAFLRAALANICHRAYIWFVYLGQEAAISPASQNMLGIYQANNAFSQ